MFGLHGLSKVKRLILGICVLLVVDLIWVASSELTEVNKYMYIKRIGEKKGIIKTLAIYLSVHQLYLDILYIHVDKIHTCILKGRI